VTLNVRVIARSLAWDVAPAAPTRQWMGPTKIFGRRCSARR
jgi:hypothetical protein